MKDKIMDVVGHRLNLMIFEGLSLVLLGIAILAWPVATLVSIVMILAVFMIVRSVIGLIGGMLSIKEGWVSFFIIMVSLLGLLLGILILKNPGISILLRVMFLGMWFVIHGIAEMTYSPKQTESSKGWLIFSGILSILAGIVLFFNPMTAGLALYWVFGVYGLLAGPMLIITALMLKSDLKKEIETV